MADWVRVSASALLREWLPASAPGARAAVFDELYQWSLRVSGSDRGAVDAALGGPLPPLGRTVEWRGGQVVGLGPDEWLLLGAGVESQAAVTALDGALPDGVALVDLSDARIGFVLAGTRAREVLAACVPLDVHPTVFGPGAATRTLLAKAPIVLQQIDDSPRYGLLAWRSHAAYVADWLADAIAGLSPAD
ncbi:MAG: sarcosine oxidase subunit gamma [Gemmatimonadales bacterium]